MRLIAGLTMSLLLAAAPLDVMAQEAVAQESVAGDDATERLALSNRFIALIQTDQMSVMFSQMMTTMIPDRQGMTAERSAALQRAMARMSADMFPRLFAVAAPIYAETFSLEELRGLVAFYESDIGQSMMKKGYEAGPRMTAAMMDILPELRNDMADAMCEELSCTAEQRAHMTGTTERSGTP